jgi:DNA-directed RNA polymerase specialized sigma24 family protein
VDPEIQERQLDVLELNDALDKLAAKYPRAAELVKLRFFAGLTRQQAAETLGVGTTTADDDWAFAKSWLRVELSEPAASES